MTRDGTLNRILSGSQAGSAKGLGRWIATAAGLAAVYFAAGKLSLAQDIFKFTLLAATGAAAVSAAFDVTSLALGGSTPWGE
jgi:hypothetical protein